MIKMEKKEDFLGYNKDEYIPILKDESISFIYQLCLEKQPKNILEIGTYIGYSASVLLSASPNAHLKTVELNKENALIAQKNLAKFQNAKVICGDAKDVIKALLEKHEKFDFIFLDGPKGQYIKYLPILKALLCLNGILVADNVYFHGMVKAEGIIPHKHRSLVNNLRKFIEAIKKDGDFKSEIHDIGDGISVSIKINN